MSWRQSGYRSAESRWICLQCKSSNTSISANCNHCSKERQNWNCYKCTHKNAMNQQKCAVCEATSPLEQQNQIGDCIGEKQKSETAEELRHLHHTEAKETFDRIVDFCKANDTTFMDEAFPLNATSIGNVGRMENDSRTTVDVPTQWLRPKYNYTRDMTFRRWDVFRDPRPQDITQGILGNCWFLAALAVVAERPEILMNILITKQYCEQGVYQVRLCVDGRWQIVTVDDYFPCTNRHLAFSEGQNNQLWVSIIEKALAKVCGSYAALTSGRCSEGLSLVTGAPCETIEIKGFGPLSSEANLVDSGDAVFDDELVWARLVSAKDASFLMGSSCGCHNDVDESPPESEFLQVGLVPKHCYSVLDVKNIHGIRLIRLRNPWGRHVWQGDWSEASPLWALPLKKQLNPHGPEKGVFWMPFEQFCSFLFWATRLIVADSGEVDLTLHSQGFRALNQMTASIMDLIVMVFKEIRHGSVGELVACSPRKISAIINLNTVLQPGTYLVVTGAFNHYGLDNTDIPTCMLTMHSFKMIAAEVFQPHPNMLGDALIRMTVAKGKEDRNRVSVTYSLSSDFCGLIVVVQNLNPYVILKIDCNCEGSHNITSVRSALVTCDVVPPRSVQIINILTQLDMSLPYSYTWKTEYNMSMCMNPFSSWNTFCDMLRHGPKMDPSFESHQPEIGQEISGIFSPRPRDAI